MPVRKESMRVLRGKYTSALIFSDSAEDYAIAQIQQLIDQPSMAGSKMRIMPDVHPGKIGPIVLVYPFLQKYFAGSIYVGAVKG